MFSSCLSVSAGVITPQHLAPLQPVQLSLTWTEAELRVLRSRALTVTNLGETELRTPGPSARHKCPSSNCLCLGPRKLTVTECAISILTKSTGARLVCVGPVCHRWLLIEAEAGQWRVGMSEVKWLYPGADISQGETWGRVSSPAGPQRLQSLQTRHFRITLLYQTSNLSYRLTNQFWVPHLTTPQVQTKGKQP